MKINIMEVQIKTGICEPMTRGKGFISVIINVENPDEVTSLYRLNEQSQKVSLPVQSVISKSDETKRYGHLGKGTSLAFNPKVPVWLVSFATN